MSIYSGYAARFTNAPTLPSGTPGIVVLSQVMSQSIDHALTLYKLGGSGSIYDAYATAMSGKPKIKLTTTQLATALEACGMAGLVFKTAATANELQLFFRLRLANGQYDTTGHEKVAIPLGFMVPKSLPLSQDQAAVLELEMTVTEDGINAPMVPSAVADANLPAVVAPVDVWTFGGIKMGSTALNFVESANIDFGIEVESLGLDGSVNPVRAHIIKVKPMITLVFSDLAQARTVFMTTQGTGSFPAAGTTTNFILSAKKKTIWGANVIIGTASHINFTGAASFGEIKSIAGDDGQNAKASIDLHVMADGTTAPLTIGINEAIAA